MFKSGAAAAARAVVVPALLFPILFALFIKLKLVNYTLIELPLFSIAIAWGITRPRLWSRIPARSLLATICCAAVLFEGAASLARLEQAAAVSTPYPTFVSEIRAFLPPGARVLGLHSYWLGLEDVDYRSFLVPLNLADEGLPLDQALSRVAPDIVLLDARMRAYFDAPEVQADHDRFYGWLTQHTAQVIGRIERTSRASVSRYAFDRGHLGPGFAVSFAMAVLAAKSFGGCRNDRRTRKKQGKNDHRPLRYGEPLASGPPREPPT